ncbi:MAG TPA: hydroxymethylbilane synthase [Bryobacteraceae bacterium]|nr:hydroxymethylbilane synthase [Bryobacteraceae bacterium]
MLTIGSRGSKLALWQANWVKDRLGELGYECRIEIITTSGDRFQHGPLKEVGNKGLFTKEIEEALRDGRVDLAVHSLKDMPTALPAGLQITATPAREDPRDVIIGAKLSELKHGARIGTGSLRRIAQLSAYRPDLAPEPMRGNVDTRLRKLDEGLYDAIVLAAAGLRRLGWEERIAEPIPPEIMCPAVGQGALAIETRADTGAAMQACARLNHADTNAAITAERAVLAQLGGGCQVPVGAHATVGNGRMHLRAVVASQDGKRIVRDELEGSSRDATRLGTELGKRLLGSGAREILAEVYGAAR